MQNTFAPSLPAALLNAFNTNNRINHYLIDHLPAAAWKASPPEGKARTAPQALRTMEQSRRALSVVLGRAITADGHVKGFPPDAIGFLAYPIAP